MAVVFPDWLQDNFVDIEQLFIDMFTKVFPAISPDNIGVWTPDNWLDQNNPDPLLSFVRLPGGRVDYDKNYDECLIQATAVTGDRTDSNKIINGIRSILLPISGLKFTMADGYTALIRDVVEIAGPQLLMPLQQIDTRVVPTTFKVCVQLRDRSRYDQIIRSL